MKINLICKECNFNYDFEVGELSQDKEMTLVFEHKTVCPKCGAIDKDKLSERGQMQATEWDMQNW